MTARSKRRFLPAALAPAMVGLALTAGCDNPGASANNPCAPARVVASPCRPTRERQVASRGCAKPQTVALNPCAVRNPCAVAAKPAILNPCAVAAKAPLLNPCAATARAPVNPCSVSPRATRVRC
jgi:hypothetical protein